MILKDILVNEEAYLLNIAGPSGSGKTSKLFYILDYWYPKDTIFAFRNYRPELIKLFPSSLRDRCRSFRSFREIIDIPCVVVLDDLPAQAYSGDYRSTDSQDFIRQLTFERHNNHKLVATSQNDMLVLKGLFESVHVYNLMAKMLPSQTDTVRNIKLQESVNNIIRLGEMCRPLTDKRAFSYCPETDELFMFPDYKLPDAVGKPYRGYVVENGNLIHV